MYDANNYLVLSVPLPFEREAQIGNGEPLLGVSVWLDIGVISELAARMDGCTAKQSHAVDCAYATPLDAALGGAVIRLLECIRSPVEASVLGPSIKRVITYRVLCGPHRDTLLSMLGRNGVESRVHAVLGRIHARYSEPLTIAGLAAEVGMSVSAFHHHFKRSRPRHPCSI